MLGVKQGHCPLLLVPHDLVRCTFVHSLQWGVDYSLPSLLDPELLERGISCFHALSSGPQQSLLLHSAPYVFVG